MKNIEELFGSSTFPANEIQKPTDKPLIECSFSEIAQRRKYREGISDGINSVKPAISDGLRHGSPECGRVMQSF